MITVSTNPILFRTELISHCIDERLISDIVCSHDLLNKAGACVSFMGRVRSDTINAKQVTAIEFSSFEEMARETMKNICDDAIRIFDLLGLSLLHRLGMAPAGEICLLVHVCTAHRQKSFEACNYLVERVKKEVPIWGKVIFDDNSYSWKINSEKNG